MNKILKEILDFQKIYDYNFKVLPTDNHSKLILDYGYCKLEFIFSNEILRTKCIQHLNNMIDLMSYFDFIIDQEDGLTYYKLKD